MAKESNSSVNQLGKLDTDSSLVGQPQGTTRFALNAVKLKFLLGIKFLL